jgi:hypothetical protein
MKKITAVNYRKDSLYPKVVRAVAEILETSDVVAPVELLMRLQWLTKQQYEDWRFGRIPYLERVCRGNLSKFNRLLRILDQHARDLKLTPSHTVYRKWGRGKQRIVVRFSKSGEPGLEAAYSRHYVAKARPPVADASDEAAPAAKGGQKESRGTAAAGDSPNASPQDAPPQGLP